MNFCVLHIQFDVRFERRERDILRKMNVKRKRKFTFFETLIEKFAKLSQFNIQKIKLYSL